MGVFVHTQAVTFYVTGCTTCSIEFAITDQYRINRVHDGKDFYCPNGHRNYFGKSLADKLRDELEIEQRRVIQARAARDDANRSREAAERSASAYKGQTTRLRNRIGNGVCPCCNRHFQNVERHMGNKHPDFRTTESTP